MKQNILATGAEAVIIKKGKNILKDRIKKGYRHEDLDNSLRLTRTRHEARIMQKASKIIYIPKIKKVSQDKIEMDFIDGKLLSLWLDKFQKKQNLNICKKIGQEIAKLHDLGIIHGDLTTSNMILHKKQIFFIDFGLAFHSSKIEDKAIDIHLLKEALRARHFKNLEICWNSFIKGYKTSKKASEVIERLKKVEKRGRYKGKGH